MNNFDYTYLIRLTDAEFQASWDLVCDAGEESVSQEMKDRLLNRGFLVHEDDSLEIAEILIACFDVISNDYVIKVETPDSLNENAELFFYAKEKHTIAVIKCDEYVELVVFDLDTNISDVVRNMLNSFSEYINGECESVEYKESSVSESFESDFKKAEHKSLFVIYLQNPNKTFAVFPKSDGGVWALLSRAEENEVSVCQGNLAYCADLVSANLKKITNFVPIVNELKNGLKYKKYEGNSDYWYEYIFNGKLKGEKF